VICQYCGIDVTGVPDDKGQERSLSDED
jgi:hypothetical protein